VIPLFLYGVGRQVATSRRQRRRLRLLPLAIVAVAGLALLLDTQTGGSITQAFDRLRVFDRQDVAETGERFPGTPSPGWAPLITAGVLVAAGGAGFALLMRRRRGPLEQRAALAASLGHALDGALDDLIAEPDPRRAIIRAYARMEIALEHLGVPRDPAEAPLEYLARVLRELTVTPGAAFALTELFEQAKFSRHTIEPEMKQEAIDALRTIQAELRELC